MIRRIDYFFQILIKILGYELFYPSDIKNNYKTQCLFIWKHQIYQCYRMRDWFVIGECVKNISVPKVACCLQKHQTYWLPFQIYTTNCIISTKYKTHTFSLLNLSAKNVWQMFLHSWWICDKKTLTMVRTLDLVAYTKKWKTLKFRKFFC